VAILILLVLIDERNELDLSLHVIKCLKLNMDIVMLRLFLKFNQILKCHVSREHLQYFLLGSLKGVSNQHCNLLFHLDQALMII
jgi:hypothetical protein